MQSANSLFYKFKCAGAKRDMKNEKNSAALHMYFSLIFIYDVLRYGYVNCAFEHSKASEYAIKTLKVIS